MFCIKFSTIFVSTIFSLSIIGAKLRSAKDEDFFSSVKICAKFSYTYTYF